MRRIIILGASGTIGQSALSVCLRHRDILELVGVHVHSSVEALEEIKKNFPRARQISSSDRVTGQSLYASGKNAIRDLIFNTEADIVLNGISGSAGFYASFWTLESGKDLAIANKESLVMAGHLLQPLAEQNSCHILPVDSEHWALFSLLSRVDKTHIQELILTASGGPFHSFSTQELEKITPEQAMKHPTWFMGPKISIDSASLANKGLEVIEAWRLFHLDSEKIKVVVHRQSLIHAMVRTNDGALYAQISKPDMQLPIQDALLYPQEEPVPAAYLDLTQHWQFSFEPVSPVLSPMLDLAYQSCQAGGAAPVIYNAANEAAVQLFRERRISFLDIPVTVEQALQKNYDVSCVDRESIFNVHQQCYDTIMSRF